MGIETGQLLETPFIETLNIGELIGQCMEHQLALALYQKPNDIQQHFIVDFNQGKSVKIINIDALPEGFVFYPFEYSSNRPGIFINADVHLVRTTDRIKVKEDQIDNINSLINLLSQTAEDGNHVDNNAHRKSGFPDKSEIIIDDQYKHIVARAVHQIHSGAFQKVVLARNKKIDLPEYFDIYGLFKGPCAAYPQTFVSVVYTPSAGLWIGASPEMLIRQNGNNVFHTTALAGTQAYHLGMDLSEASWTQKDIEEQALVCRYIINCFKKIRLREYNEVGPKTIKAGNLLHLKTDYYVDLYEIDFPQLSSIMLELLHPTSAVCGMPKEPALNFINQSEGFQRMYYSGFMGPVNVHQSTDLFVNLRCMLVEGKQAELFAGAGITADSNPEKEWLETELKFGTLMEVIKKM